MIGVVRVIGAQRIMLAGCELRLGGVWRGAIGRLTKGVWLRYKERIFESDDVVMGLA
jgi:hypothetical protein